MSQSLLVPRMRRARKDPGHSTGPRMTGTDGRSRPSGSARCRRAAQAPAPAQSDHTRKVTALRRAEAPREGHDDRFEAFVFGAAAAAGQ